MSGILLLCSFLQGYDCYKAEGGSFTPICQVILRGNLDNVPCHSQEIERRVALTSQAVSSCVGLEKQNGTALAIEEDRVERPRSTM